MRSKKALLSFILSIVYLNTLESKEAWKLLDSYVQSNNHQTLEGEMLYKDKNGVQLAKAHLEIQVPHFIELSMSSKKEKMISLFKLERSRIQIVRTEAKESSKNLPYEVFLSLEKLLFNMNRFSEKSLFTNYKKAGLFKIKSLYEEPFQMIEFESASAKIPLQTGRILFDSHKKIQSIRIHFKNSAYGSFTVTPSSTPEIPSKELAYIK